MSLLAETTLRLYSNPKHYSLTFLCNWITVILLNVIRYCPALSPLKAFSKIYNRNREIDGKREDVICTLRRDLTSPVGSGL